MANKLCTDAELTTVANAIRSKGGTTAQLGFPDGMATAIGNLNVGTGLSPAASAGDILSGKKAVVNRQTITGTIASKTSSNVTVSGNTVSIPAGHYASAVSKTVGTAKAAATYYPSTNDQTISSGQYLTGAQTIKGVKITMGDRSSSPNHATAIMYIGDSADEDRIGTYTAVANLTGNQIILNITKTG